MNSYIVAGIILGAISAFCFYYGTHIDAKQSSAELKLAYQTKFTELATRLEILLANPERATDEEKEKLASNLQDLGAHLKIDTNSVAIRLQQNKSEKETRRLQLSNQTRFAYQFLVDLFNNTCKAQFTETEVMLHLADLPENFVSQQFSSFVRTEKYALQVRTYLLESVALPMLSIELLELTQSYQSDDPLALSSPRGEGSINFDFTSFDANVREFPKTQIYRFIRKVCVSNR